MQNLDYNVPGGKLNRGISVVDSVEILKGRALTDEEYFKAALLGWCVEFVSPFVLTARPLALALPRFRGRARKSRMCR